MLAQARHVEEEGLLLPKMPVNLLHDRGFRAVFDFWVRLLESGGFQADAFAFQGAGSALSTKQGMVSDSAGVLSVQPENMTAAVARFFTEWKSVTQHWFSEEEAREAKVINTWDGIISMPDKK
jgi:hypothetical protein